MRPVLVAGANEYRLLERVATTSLGSVHRAQHVASGRVVEVRLLQRLADQPAGARTFAQGMPAIAALRHRGILSVESWGDTDGVPSVVTPAPEAESLADRLAKARLPDRRTALRLLREIAEAVDYAHRLGVVHGDLGPANVLVTAGGSALVAYFGLAALSGAAPLPGGTGLRHGSPAHVAPERFPSGTLGPAADVYALAVVAWQLMTGKLPPDGAPPEAAVGILRRGMDRDPGARWATCSELVAGLEAALTGDPPPAAAPAVAPDPAPPAAGRLGGIPVRTWLAAVCGLLLLGVLGGVIVTGERPDGSTATANRQRQAGATPYLPTLAPPPATASDLPSPSPSPTPRPTATAVPLPVATVRPAPTPSTTAAAISVSVANTNPEPGEPNVMVTGHGFDPSQQYQIFFVQNSTVTLFGPASPGAGGDFTNPVRIPRNARPGPAVIKACVYVVNGGPTSSCATAQISVQDQTG
jgi:eukaryotic-like serine/threonine-protein kinase